MVESFRIILIENIHAQYQLETLVVPAMDTSFALVILVEDPSYLVTKPQLIMVVLTPGSKHLEDCGILDNLCKDANISQYCAPTNTLSFLATQDLLHSNRVFIASTC